MFALRRSLPRVAAPAFRRAFSVARPVAQAATPDKHKAADATTPPGFSREGAISTNYEVATGAHRYEYLTYLKGEEPWEDMHPIYLEKAGTVKEPIVLRGVDPVRYIACTGFPAESHEAVWLTLNPQHKHDRCPHCGNVFKYEQEHDDHHH
ncbi:cytochrome c oxidase subunit VB-domain-containing protein [Polychytrium aggregatum]|uniref:cytochrome c oxidase subunit VB-domain-containing protein n=1 Tax=Polychytrium aggregatum TaxID=110093 RepID=UPI0022FF2C8B|nr:cytochrome c oxidase subunit VB-domain-containing protein [Polychytrium aggregatum]KAI9205360.1 cytochrome c oxidase subunit VB-domain-containing protein [Polychytrium aggregatum]